MRLTLLLYSYLTPKSKLLSSFTSIASLITSCSSAYIRTPLQPHQHQRQQLLLLSNHPRPAALHSNLQFRNTYRSMVNSSRSSRRGEKRPIIESESKIENNDNHDATNTESGIKKRTKKGTNVQSDTTETSKTNTRQPKNTKVEAQRITERDTIPRLWDADRARMEHGSYTFKIMSWNVAGLRAVLTKFPEAIPNLVTQHNIDVLCLQETKLQDIHVTDPKLKIKGFLLENEGYDSHYNCATAKKGYSGTAVFIKRRTITKQQQEGDVTSSKQGTKKQASIAGFLKTKKETTKDNSQIATTSSELSPDFNIQNLIPTSITYGLGNDEHDQEGRVITVDFPLFTMTNVYVPNSGQTLDRLQYRTESWDKDFVQIMNKKQASTNTKKPVIWLGDLNVAHKNLDCWNDGAKHLAKQAGTTPEERSSFQSQLDWEGEGSFVDVFRHLYPEAKGHYTYWSQRAGNREPNKGLRLDYFICSKQLLEDGDNQKVTVRDTYMVPDQVGSDHCPIVLELEIRKD